MGYSISLAMSVNRLIAESIQTRFVMIFNVLYLLKAKKRCSVYLCAAKISTQAGAFGKDGSETPEKEDVKRNWEQLKLKEGKKSLLSGVPKSLPAMVKSYRLQEKTKQVGFEWDHIDQVWAKVEEEIAELKSNIDQGRPQDEIEDEFGDVIFSLINYGRFLKIDPEAALEKVNRKFISRFEYIEAKASKPLNDMSLEEMDALWNEAKRVKKEDNL